MLCNGNVKMQEPLKPAAIKWFATVVMIIKVTQDQWIWHNSIGHIFPTVSVVHW